MMDTSSYFMFSGAVLHYSVRGRGGKAMLSFHGYGQSNECFKKLDEELSENYTIYSFDLFYHGQSFWHKKDEPMSKHFLREMILSFLNEKNIGRFSVLGFSMGGKFALGVLEAFSERVEEVILIAPDGVRRNPWYVLATSYRLPRKLLRRIVLRPGLYLGMAKFFSGAGFLNNRVTKFSNSQMATVKQRRRVYFSWVVFRLLCYDVRALASLINKHEIKVTFFLGKYDKIITISHLKRFLKYIKSSEVYVLQAGHSNLINAVADFYRKRNEK
ncbi:alpha/beta hydrolase [Cytophagaceae bacterium ABcell3]|nr:alpha/beta hydrolase [Cytophagaceae bacterium ABcell3]